MQKDAKQQKKPDSVCTECGQVIPGGGGRRLCDACRKRHAAEHVREQRAARRERWLRTPQHCERCGAEFFGKGKCRFCLACRNQERGEARRRENKRVSWVVGRARKGLDNRPDPGIVGDAGSAGPDRPAQPQRKGRGKGLRDPMEGAVLREDGVLVLRPCELQKARRRPPTPPKQGTRPGSMEDVSYRLDLENYERWMRGERPISYGYFVAYLEGRIPLKK